MKSSRRSCTPRRERLVLAGLLAAALIAAVLSLCLGAVGLTPAQLLRAVQAGPEELSGRIFWFVRLPRTLAALLTGAALAVSGVVIQTVLHNPLAAPNIIGVNAGAGFAVALGTVFFPGAAVFYPGLSFAGAMLAVILVLGISQLTGAARITLVLGGVMISSLFGALIDTLLAFWPDALTGYADFRVGSFSGITMSRVRSAAWPVGVSLCLLLTLAHPMEVLSLGDETAQTLGLNVRLLRVALLMLAAVLAGCAVSMAGIVGFVGLIVPHFVRRLIGEKTLPLLAASALGGCCFVTLCDTAARTVFSPYELPVGIALSLIGVPVFLWQLIHTRRRQFD